MKTKVTIFLNVLIFFGNFIFLNLFNAILLHGFEELMLNQNEENSEFLSKNYDKKIDKDAVDFMLNKEKPSVKIRSINSIKKLSTKDFCKNLYVNNQRKSQKNEIFHTDSNLSFSKSNSLTIKSKLELENFSLKLKFFEKIFANIYGEEFIFTNNF